MFDSIQSAIKDIKAGKIVIVTDDEDRENEGDFVMAADCVNAKAINFMATQGRGLVCMPVSNGIACKLNLHPMVMDNTENTGCNFTVSIDHKDTGTGISASDRAKTIKKVLAKTAKPQDFKRPGHVFPIIAQDGGVLVRAGHTEAATDLAKMAGLSPAGVICEISKDDGEMARLPDLKKIAKTHSLKMITIKDLIEYRRKTEKFVVKKVEIPLPTKYADFRVKAYENILDGKVHLALILGDILTKKPVLTRVHSECLTGDTFKSLRCDCHSQLDLALKKIAKAKRGVLIYMTDEGRGIGLLNKLKAYALQDKGCDTVEANEELGFPADLREYGIGAQILADLGLKKIELMTNNPAKVVGLKGYGIEIAKRIPIEFSPNKKNASYLKTKKAKMGHILKKV
jgi:3,4-dihydroxy 2-butanone 4-phosphate synthase / GTP cyclohydrolase II